MTAAGTILLGDTLFVGVNPVGHRVWRSTNNGGSFSGPLYDTGHSFNDTLERAYHSFCQLPSTGRVCFGGNHVSDDDGATWSLQSGTPFGTADTGLGRGSGQCASAIFMVPGDVAQGYRSTDGINWSTMPTVINAAGLQILSPFTQETTLKTDSDAGVGVDAVSDLQVKVQVQDFDITEPTVQGFGVTEPTVQGFGVTEPTAQGFDVTEPTAQGFGVTEPTTQGWTITPTGSG